MTDPDERPADELLTAAVDEPVVCPSLAPTESGPRPPKSALPSELPPRIGPYRVLRLLGEGGMGMVLECEQEAPLRRRVALKLMRTGMASSEFVARFATERQALAQMNHPAIARVFDAGVGEWGHDSLDNLANMLFTSGDYAAALPLYERALAIRERTLGSDHPRLAAGLSNLGALLAQLGRHDLARTLLVLALAIKEKVYGPDHPNLATTLADLASLESDAGNVRAAWPLAERALAIPERSFGPDHPETATELRTAATVLYAAGDLAGARPLATRALAVAERALGPNHPTTATCRWVLIFIDFALGDQEGARDRAGAALDALARALGEEHPLTTFERARWSALQGDRAAALRWLRLAGERGFASPARVRASELGRWRGEEELEAILAGMGTRSGDQPRE